MSFSLRSVGFAVFAGLSVALIPGCIFGQSGTASPGNIPSSDTLLPMHLFGWTAERNAKTGSSAAEADAANADVLNEYGLKAFAEGRYRRADSTMSLRVMRFVDATGAYGAYTFYRRADMRPVYLGNGGAGDSHEIVFWSGVTVVDATSASGTQILPSLRTFVAALPQAAGSIGVPPTLPTYLPQDFLDRLSVRYAIGPAAYTRGGGVLPSNTVDFSRDAEAVTAQYRIHGDIGTLTLIEYPTPQMAVHSEATLNALIKNPLPAGLQQGNTAALAVRRAGPIVAVTSGNFSNAEAQALLAEVKYSADVTWNKGEGNTKREVKNAAAMLLGIAYLTAILAACAILLGSFLGGGRALWRIVHGKPASAVYEEDFISLNLTTWSSDSARKMP